MRRQINQAMPVALQASAPRGLSMLLWRASALALELLSNRLVMLGVMELSLVLYVWNAPHTIDYQEFDEADYFFRAYQVAHGDAGGAVLTDPGRNPLYILYYLLWYALLHTSNLYPLIMTSSILLLGIGAYLLLARVFHPLLSWALGILVVAWSVPFAPNCLYLFATGCLWLSLAVLGKRMWQRGLAALLVLLCVLVRPDFLLVAVVLLVLLGIYEWRLARRARPPWRVIATCYMPVVVCCLLGVYFYLSASQGFQGASSFALERSYTDYYRVNYPSQFDPLYSYANASRLFEKDFGALPSSPSFLVTLGTMTHNPPMAARYVGYETARLLAGFGTATLDLNAWHYDHLATQPVVVTGRNTVLFGLGWLAFLGVAAGCLLALRRRGISVLAGFAEKTPMLLGYVSLSSLVPLLLLINPHQRFYMLYPLVLLPVGVGLIAIGRAMRLVPWARVLTPLPVRALLALWLLLTVIAVLPQPFAHEPPSGHFVERTLVFLRRYVPANSLLIAQPGTSFAEYLTGSGVPMRGVDAATYLGNGNVLDNVLSAYPAASQVYILFNNNIPYGAENPWFSAWKGRYPQIPLIPVAKLQDPYLLLYRLPSDVGARVAYLNLLALARQGSVGGATAALPSYTAMDFGARLTWTGNDPRNDVTPEHWQIYNWGTLAIVMYPDLPDVWPIRAHTVTATLPAEWSGKTLVFAGAFAPWETSHSDADGTRLLFSVAGTDYQQVVPLPNTAPHQWVPIVVRLPHYAGAATLQVTVRPRASLLWDDTLLSFVGLAASPPDGTGPALGAGTP